MLCNAASLEDFKKDIAITLIQKECNRLLDKHLEQKQKKEEQESKEEVNVI